MTKHYHRLSIVCVNDVYSFDDVDDSSDHPRGGWCRAASLIKQLVRQKQNSGDESDQKTNNTVLTVVNGDVLGGSSLLVNSEGSVAIEVMNNIGVDLAVLGNHEFDYGDEQLIQRMRESNFDWLGSNVYYPHQNGINQEKISVQDDASAASVVVDDDDGDRYYFPHVLGNGKTFVLSNNLKLGIFGLVTKQTPKISSPSDNVIFDHDILGVARRTANTLRVQGAQVIVAITHLSEAEDRLLAQDKLAGVDLILGGHEHEPLADMIHRNSQEDSSEAEDRGVGEEEPHKHNDGGVLLFKSGMNAYWVGSVDLDIMSEDNHITISTSWSMQAVNSLVETDQTTSDIVNRYRKRTDESAMISAFGEDLASNLSLDDVIATIGDNSTSDSNTDASTMLPLDTRMSSVRRRESTGGNLVADAMLWMLKTNYAHTDDNAVSDKLPMLAMINGGFIRGDRLYKHGSKITVRTILKELPFPRTMKVLEIEGCHLRNAMAQQFKGSSTGPTGAYPHLSSNACLAYQQLSSSNETDSDEVIHIQSFTVDGVEISDRQKYMIAVTCFVAGGNEGCSSWLQSKCIQNSAWDDVNMSCILLKYLQCHRVIHPVLEDRVKVHK